MRRLLALLSALACAATVALVGAPAHAGTGITLHYDTIEWDHLGHQVYIDAEYVTTYGNPAYMSQVTLWCDPADSTKWGSGNNIDGLELSWGAYNGSTYNIYKSLLNGGNIGNCTDSYNYGLYTGSDIPQTGNWGIRMKYHFATNYNNPSNNVQPTIYLDIPWPSGGGGGGGGTPGDCSGAVTLHGSGSIGSCHESDVYL